MASAALLAYILVSKYDDHLPLYRLAKIFARMGADIPDSTLVDWCGRAMKVLQPLIERIEADVMASDLLHADDTPIRVLDKSLRDRGLGKGVKKGRIWAYARDQRPWAGASPPGAVYTFSPDWKEEHVHRHLANTRGILQADGYTGYAKLYAPDTGGTPRLREAACWAHLRRDFHDEWSKTKSTIAREALDRIGGLYDIEREITGQPADIRLAARKKHSGPKVGAFFAWAENQLALIPGKGDLAKAFRYGLSRRAAFSLFLEDGRVAKDNNPAERALRPIGIRRKNWLFAGADTGTETLARAMTLIETCKMNGLDPQAYLADILARIHDHKINRLDELGTTHGPNWRGRLMATITQICSLEYAAKMMDEDLALLEAIVWNDDNLTYGSVVTVHTGPEEPITALTDDGIEELTDMLRDARISTKTWHQFLDAFVHDTELVARFKAQSPR
jgi:transposase